MTHTPARVIGLYFTGFYCGHNRHHRRRDPGSALSDTVCLSHSFCHLQLSPAPQCPLTEARPGWSIAQPVRPAPGVLLPLVLALVTALLQTSWVCVEVSGDQKEAVPWPSVSSTIIQLTLACCQTQPAQSLPLETDDLLIH